MGDRPLLDEQFKAELEALTASMCKALNDPKRLAVMYLLADGPQTVGSLAELIGAAQANVSQHLAVLRERGLVTGDRQGTSIEYSLCHPQVIDAIDLLREIQRDALEQRLAVTATADPSFRQGGNPHLQAD